MADWYLVPHLMIPIPAPHETELGVLMFVVLDVPKAISEWAQESIDRALEGDR